MSRTLTRARPVRGAQEKLDSATRTILLVVLAFLPVVFALACEVAGGLGPLEYSGAMDCAQLGRNILEGRGLVTDLLTPLTVALSEPAHPVADITHPPLYPISLAILFGLFGKSDSVVVGASAGFFVLCGLMVFLIARREFSLVVAALATALFFTQFEAARYAFSGAGVLAGALFMLVFWYVLTAPGPASLRRYIKAGAAFGLGYLTQYSFAVLLPAVILYIHATAPSRRKLCVVVFLIGALLVASPWLVRNAVVMHNPFFTTAQYDLLTQTDSYSGYNIHRSLADTPSPLVFAAAHPAQVARKMLNGIVLMYWQVPMVLGLYLVPFFLLALFSHTRDRELVSRLNLVVALVVLQALGICLGDHMSMHLLKLVPLVTIFAAGYLVHIVGRRVSTPARRAALLVVFVLGAFIPTGMELLKSAKAVPVGVPSALAELDTALPAKANVLTDCPWAVAWYTRRTSIWLPLDMRRLDSIERKVGPVNAALVSPYAASFTSVRQAAVVKQLSQLEEGDGFRVVRVFDSGDILLARRGLKIAPAGPSGAAEDPRRGAGGRVRF